MKNSTSPQYKSSFFLTLSFFILQLTLALAQTDPLTVVDELPSFPGGIPALKKYLDTNLDFPLVADLAEERLVVVEFVVNADGKTIDPKIIWGQNDTANTAAKKLISAMPKWFPGLNDDLPVSTWVRLPITYYRPVIKGRIESDHAQISSEIRQSLYFDIDFPGAVTKATFPGGTLGLKTHLAKNLQYPRVAKENRVFGSVLVRFTVNKSGIPENFLVEQGIGAGCDEEAIRILKMMPIWKPATLDGEPIATKQMIYVPFKLEQDEFPNVNKLVDVMPVFPGGEMALKEYVDFNLGYISDVPKGEDQYVITRFVVSKEGLIQDIEVIQGISETLNQKALNLITNMPRWTPGQQGNQSAAVRVELPIRFIVPVPKKEPIPKKATNTFPVNPDVQNPARDSITVYKVVEQMPSFPLGQAAMLQFLNQNLEYPRIAKENGVNGVVIVQMIVEQDGTLSNPHVIKGIGAGCDEEALRVVKMMPRWKPGFQKGQAVRVQFNLPIWFKLDN